MIIPGQSNIKVHFAGAENLIRSNLILKGINSNYSLFTIYPFLCNKFGIKHGYQGNSVTTYSEIATNNDLNSNHSIQDSGLFTLMFGSQSGKKDTAFIDKWYHELVNTTLEGRYKGTCVEVDCQKVLGVEKAWEYRVKMKEDLPNRIINVFHKEDGQKGLDRLIEFSDYIAISVPELRAIGQKKYTVKIANYIKNRKPSIDIHLLGCTENKLLRELSFCSSADSTSWVSLNKFGWFKYNNGQKTISIKKSNIKKSILEEKYYRILKELFKQSKLKEKESLLYYHACDLFQLEYMLKQYSIYAGNQN